MQSNSLRAPWLWRLGIQPQHTIGWSVWVHILYILIQPCRTVQVSVLQPWQCPGCCLYPLLQPTYRFYNRTPTSFSSPAHCPTPFLNSGRCHQRLALRYVSLAKGGFCQGHSACLCVPPSLMRGKRKMYYNWTQESTDHFCISGFNALCRVEAILWESLAVCLQ